MEEKTTTEAPAEAGGTTIQGVPVDDQGQAVSQPEPTEQAEAVKTTDDTSEQKTESQPSEPSEDDQLAKWAEKKGLTLDSDNATKAAKMAREAERAMHQKAQKASELEKTLTGTSDQIAEEVALSTGQDPELLKRLQRVEVKEAVRDFWNTPNSDGTVPDRSLEPQMIEILQEKPHLAGDLESLYATTLVKSGNIGAVKSQGKREALESLAQKQQASVPRGNAVNSSATTPQITSENVDELVGKNSMDWFNANRDAVNRAMAG